MLRVDSEGIPKIVQRIRRSYTGNHWVVEYFDGHTFDFYDTDNIESPDVERGLIVVWQEKFGLNFPD